MCSQHHRPPALVPGGQRPQAARGALAGHRHRAAAGDGEQRPAGADARMYRQGVAGEWTPRGLWPLTAWDEGGRAVLL